MLTGFLFTALYFLSKKKSKQVKKNANATVFQTEILLSNKSFQNKVQPSFVSFHRKKSKYL